MGDELFENLFAALAAAPDAHELRLQVARMLLERGRAGEAAEQASIVLRARPTDADALAVLTAASGAPAAASPAEPLAPAEPVEPPESVVAAAPEPEEFDWRLAERDLGLTIPGPAIGLDDVGGLDDVKGRLRETFLDPMRNPELAQAFGTSLRGGLLLYGPPGCGKTHIARAIAGELGARFLTADIADLLSGILGESERNVAALFDAARTTRPTVLFLDELDALGGRRSAIGSGFAGMRSLVNQFLLEMDSLTADNEGLFVLAASNAPWSVDPALLRPGRLDRTMLVPPPDEAAREVILRRLLASRPTRDLDLPRIVSATKDFSGADLDHLVESAAQKAMSRSLAAGSVDPVTMADVTSVLKEIRPSIGGWLAEARNVVDFANADGRYDDLRALLSRRGRRG